MNITMQVVKHEEQRYETVGDWIFLSPTQLNITVSDTGNWKYNFLVGLHEQIEAILCLEAGVNEEEVTKFDLMFEDERINGLHSETDEPGDDPRAPYHKQHVFATLIEKETAAKLNVDWGNYEETIYAL